MSGTNEPPSGRLYFLHLAKTAGNSVYTVLDLQFRRREICPANSWEKLEERGVTDLRDYRLFRGHFGYDFRAILPPHACMTMLRQPYDTSLSVFGHLKRAPGLAKPFCPGKDIVRYVREDRDEAAVVLGANYHRQLLPKSFWEAPSDERIDRAVRTLEEVEFVGITERFEESMLLLCATFGWSPVGETPRLNSRPDRTPGHDLPPDVASALREMNLENDAVYRRGYRLFEERRFASYRSFVRERHRSIRMGEPPRDEIALRFDDRLQGAGWHRHEGITGKDAPVPFRWTGPGCEATLDLRLDPSHDLKVEIFVVNAIREDVSQSLRLEVNGEPIPLVVTVEGGYTVFSGWIPRGVLASRPRLARFLFRTNETLSAASLGTGPDLRKKGVAISRLELSRLQTPAGLS